MFQKYAKLRMKYSGVRICQILNCPLTAIVCVYPPSLEPPLLREKSTCTYYGRLSIWVPPERKLVKENKTKPKTKKNKIQNPKSRKPKCSWKVWLTGENLPTNSSPAVSGQHVDHWALLALTIVPPALEHGFRKHREANLFRGIFSPDGCWVSRTTLGGWFCHCVLYSQSLMEVAMDYI